MSEQETFDTFNNATPKQIEAITLAAEGLTSKQIALELGVAPRTIDQRIDALRFKLGGITRNDLVRHYRAWRAICDRATYDPFPLTGQIPDPPQMSPQPEAPFLFEDALTFDGRTDWDRKANWLQPGIKPSDLGPGTRLLFIMAGSVLILAGVVLTAAFSNSLADLMSR